MNQCALGMIAALTWLSPAWAAAQDSGVVVADKSLPSVETAYHGGGPHVFLDGQATLFCGSHGHFTSAVEPPRRPGATAVSDYFATFVGELTLAPPLESSTATFPIQEQAHMVERITLHERRRGSQVFRTELQTFDLRGAGMPRRIMVRESPTRGSLGRTTVTALDGGGYRIEGFYDVWLEISLDGGQSWHPAKAPVRMSIAPAARGPRRLSAGG